MSTPEPSSPSLRLRALGERIAREEDASSPARSRRSMRRCALRLVRAATASPRARGSRPRSPRRSRSSGSGRSAMVRSRPLVFSVGTASTATATASGDWISAPPNVPVPIRFSEGTEVELEPEAHARVAEVTRKGAHVLLESGAARVCVTPNRGGQWVFTAGPFQVDVKGTKFELAWSPREQLFTLKLIEGSVFVSGCALGEGHPLFAGETLSASCLSREFHIDGTSAAKAVSVPSALATAAAPSAVTAPLPAPVVPVLDPDESATRPVPVPGVPTRAPSGRAGRSAGSGGAGTDGETWQSLARASRFKDAFARVNERGFDAELAHAGKDDLLLLGDVARLSGDAGRALLAYERVRSRASGERGGRQRRVRDRAGRLRPARGVRGGRALVRDLPQRTELRAPRARRDREADGGAFARRRRGGSGAGRGRVPSEVPEWTARTSCQDAAHGGQLGELVPRCSA